MSTIKSHAWCVNGIVRQHRSALAASRSPSRRVRSAMGLVYPRFHNYRERRRMLSHMRTTGPQSTCFWALLRPCEPHTLAKQRMRNWVNECRRSVVLVARLSSP
jgi:hypothetical protein